MNTYNETGSFPSEKHCPFAPVVKNFLFFATADMIEIQ